MEFAPRARDVLGRDVHLRPFSLNIYFLHMSWKRRKRKKAGRVRRREENRALVRRRAEDARQAVAVALQDRLAAAPLAALTRFQVIPKSGIF